eukprot:557051-Pyramimonas_sp.AAC.1
MSKHGNPVAGSFTVIIGAGGLGASFRTMAWSFLNCQYCLVAMSCTVASSKTGAALPLRGGGSM